MLLSLGATGVFLTAALTVALSASIWGRCAQKRQYKTTEVTATTLTFCSSSSSSLDLPFTANHHKNGWTVVCKFLAKGWPLLLKGLPGAVGRYWHYGICVLQTILWRQESCDRY